MRNAHKQREPVRGENSRGTRVSAESPMLAVPPDSDYGSEGWGFESLRACHRNPCTVGVSLADVLRGETAWAVFLVVFWVETLFRFSEHALYRRAVSGSEMPGSQGVKGSNPLRSTGREIGGTPATAGIPPGQGVCSGAGWLSDW
jgi:hypothetical protein